MQPDRLRLQPFGPFGGEVPVDLVGGELAELDGAERRDEVVADDPGVVLAGGGPQVVGEPGGFLPFGEEVGDGRFGGAGFGGVGFGGELAELAEGFGFGGGVDGAGQLAGPSGDGVGADVDAESPDSGPAVFDGAFASPAAFPGERLTSQRQTSQFEGGCLPKASRCSSRRRS